MNGLLNYQGDTAQEDTPVAKQARKGILNPGSGLGNNVSLQELLQFLFKRGLLSPAAKAITPVDNVGDQSIEDALTVRQRQMNQLGL